MKKILFLASIVTLASCTKATLNSSSPINTSGVNKLSFNSTGNTYYVDSTATGNDSNNGLSAATPWRTIAKVNTITFSPGDRILFKCGNSWKGQLHPKGSGSSGTPIIIDQYGAGNKPIIRGPGTTSSAGVLLYDQSYWEINDLEITNYHTGGDTLLRGIFVTNTNLTTKANYIHINNCYVHDVDAYGYAANPTLYSKLTGGIILYGYFDDLQVRNCHVANCSVEGLRTLPYPSGTSLSTNVKFVANTIENIYGDGIVLSTVSAGLIDSNVVKNACMSNDQDYAGCWTYHSQNSIVSHNEVYNLSGGKGDGEAFDADENTNGDIFEYNYTHDNSNGFMEFMPTATNIIVRYNVSANDCKAGVRLLNYLPSTTSNSLYNNVWYVGNNINELIDGYSAVGFNGTLKNNIFYCTGTVTKFCKSGAGTSSICLNNCLYPASITSVNGPVGTVSGNINTNPSFVNGGSHSLGLSSATAYQLSNGSPCLNTGIPVSGNGTYDYNHNLLTTGYPDMGAFQHNITTNNFGTTADAYVRNGIYGNINYGASDTLFIKADASSYFRKAYLKFGYTPVTLQKVQSALLNIYAFRVGTDTSRTLSVYTTTTESWGENSITWNNSPMDTVYVGKINIKNTGLYTLDVSNAINLQLSKTDHLVSFLLVNKGANSSAGDVQFYSKEAAAHQPLLSVSY